MCPLSHFIVFSNPKYPLFSKSISVERFTNIPKIDEESNEASSVCNNWNLECSVKYKIVYPHQTTLTRVLVSK